MLKTSIDFRSLILDRYVSSSVGTHRRMDGQSLESFCKAHHYYLREWLPSNLPDCRWLDVGCGQGALMVLAQKLGCRDIVGIDISDEMLATCRQHSLRVFRADVWQHLAGAASGRLNIISAFDLLEHFPKEKGFELLCEIRRALVPGGMCLIKIPNAASPWGQGVTASDLTHEAAYTSVSLTQMASLAGFSRCEIREIGPTPITIRSRIRQMLWFFVRTGYRFLNEVEAGASTSDVFTRVMIAKLS